MHNSYPNPWDFNNQVKQMFSPFENNHLEYYNLQEIAMGSPIRGICYLIDKDERKIFLGDCFGGPPVWETEGHLVAIPIWSHRIFKGLIQRIAIFDLDTYKMTVYSKTFRVLDLKSFSGSEISGFDSPIYNTKVVKFNLKSEKIKEIKCFNSVQTDSHKVTLP